jgi:hypothetical protein
MVQAITIEQARRVRDQVLARFGVRPEVVGVGIAPDAARRYVVKVNLAEELPPDDALPDEIDGVPLRAEIVGTIRALGR